jgi:serine/threonine protein kinase
MMLASPTRAGQEFRAGSSDAARRRFSRDYADLMDSLPQTRLSHCRGCNAELAETEDDGLCPACSEANRPSSHSPTVICDTGPRKVASSQGAPSDFGDYRLLRLLGRGGMGAVYEAEQKSTGRRIALKLLEHALESEESRKRFLREGRLAASINHPNSVFIFGTEEIDGTPIIAMELVPGGTLQDRVAMIGALPVTEAVESILQVIAGLEAAAAVGVLHRDIKPSNCFIDTDGTIKVGDFGLSISTLAR